MLRLAGTPAARPAPRTARTRQSPSRRSARARPAPAPAAPRAPARRARPELGRPAGSAQRPLHLRKDRLVLDLAHVLFRQRPAQLLQQLPLAAAELARYHHVQDDLLVAAPAAADRRHALPAQRDDRPRLRAGRYVDLLVAVQRGHRDGGAERRRRGRHVHHGDEVVAVAHEALVLRHANEHVEVPRRAAALPGVAPAGEPDALLVGDPGRHVHFERALPPHGHVAALHAAGAAATAEGAEGIAAEEGVEYVRERPEPVGRRREAARVEALVTVAVVGGAPLGVGQDLVGLGGLLELLLGLRIVPVDVGVQLAREPPEGLLDLTVARVSGDPEHLVRISPHSSYTSATKRESSRAASRTAPMAPG